MIRLKRSDILSSDYVVPGLGKSYWDVNNLADVVVRRVSSAVLHIKSVINEQENVQ